MQLIIFEDGSGPLEIVKSLSNVPRLSKLIPHQSYTVTGNNARGFFEFFAGEGFYFTHSKYNAMRYSVWRGNALQSATELRIAKGRALRGKWHGLANPELLRGQFTLCYNKVIDTEVQFDPADDYETVDVHYELPFLERLAPDFPLLDIFVNEIHRGNPFEVSPIKHYCTAEMERILYRLFNTPYDAVRQKYLLERSACDLLLEALFKMHDKDADDFAVKLTPSEIEVIYEVKQKIISDDFEVPLNKLLADCNIGIHKLNAGFKRFFGDTPYQYHMTHKMDIAVFKLLNTNLSIAEIAYSLNYNLPLNFTLEFTKRFDCPPTEYRRRHKVGRR